MAGKRKSYDKEFKVSAIKPKLFVRKSLSLNTIAKKE